MYPVQGTFTPDCTQEDKTKTKWLEWQVEILSTCISKRYCASADELRTLETVRNAYQQMLDQMKRKGEYVSTMYAIGDH